MDVDVGDVTNHTFIDAMIDDVKTLVKYFFFELGHDEFRGTPYPRCRYDSTGCITAVQWPEIYKQPLNWSNNFQETLYVFLYDRKGRGHVYDELERAQPPVPTPHPYTVAFTLPGAVYAVGPSFNRREAGPKVDVHSTMDLLTSYHNSTTAADHDLSKVVIREKIVLIWFLLQELVK